MVLFKAGARSASVEGRPSGSMSTMALTNAEFAAILEDASKRIPGCIVSKEDEDRLLRAEVLECRIYQ